MTRTGPRHSALGVAALVVSLVALVLFAVTAHVAHLPRYADMQDVPVAVLVMLFVSLGVTIVGLLLGIGSALQHQRRRVTGVLALGLSITLLWAQASLGSWVHQQWEQAHPAAPPADRASASPATPLQ
jgi:predicted lysophospholipase L1 biosynthesis ABC-type transport system permease subunit